MRGTEADSAEMKSVACTRGKVRYTPRRNRAMCIHFVRRVPARKYNYVAALSHREIRFVAFNSRENLRAARTQSARAPPRCRRIFILARNLPGNSIPLVTGFQI